MHRNTTLYSLTRSARALHLQALVLLAIAEVALSGTFTAQCSAAVQRQFAEAVEACPLAVLTQVSSCAPSGPDFKTAATECAPGCKCAQASVGKTGEPYTVFGMHEYCNAQFYVRVLQGSMFIDPYMNCNRITYCPFCVEERCRYKCADISSQSCAAQLRASVAQLDASDAPRETAAADEVSPACLTSAGDKGPLESATSPERAASIDEGASVGDANAPKKAVSVNDGASVGDANAPKKAVSVDEGASVGDASAPKKAASVEEASSEKSSSEKASSEKEEVKRETLGFEEIVGIISGIVGVIGVVVAIITLRYQKMGMGSVSNESV